MSGSTHRYGKRSQPLPFSLEIRLLKLLHDRLQILFVNAVALDVADPDLLEPSGTDHVVMAS